MDSNDAAESEHGDRGERGDRGDRSDRSDRGDRSDRSDRSDRGPRNIEVSARVHDHLDAMEMPDESTSETLERLLGLTPDPATVAGDALSTPLPEDPAVPDSLAADPTTDATAVDPSDIPEPSVAPADVEASLGELAGILDDDERAKMEALLAEIAAADPEELEGIVSSLDAERDDAGSGEDTRSGDDTEPDDA